MLLALEVVVLAPTIHGRRPNITTHHGLKIVEASDRILMLSPAANRIYSRWDKIKHEALSPYGRACAEAVRRAPLPARARVLMLGLGGGVIAGDLLCGSSGAKRDAALAIDEVVAIELSLAVTQAAQERFLPVIFSGACAEMRPKLRIVNGDALEAAKLMAGARGKVRRSQRFHAFIVDVPPGYEAAEAAPIEFWRSLAGLAAPGAVLVVNTIFGEQQELGVFARRLQSGAWATTKQELVVSTSPQSSARGSAKWRPRANVVFTARLNDTWVARGRRLRH